MTFRTNGFKVYLAGIMDKATDSEMNDWRDEAEELFKYNSVSVLNPCRRPHNADLSPKEIFELDLIDVRNADVVLADMRDLGKPLFGTPCEIFYASYVLQKPVIGWYTKETEPSGPRPFQKTLIHRELPSLEEAIDHIIAYYV